MTLPIDIVKARAKNFFRENNCDLGATEYDDIVLKNCNTVVEIVEGLIPEDYVREHLLNKNSYSTLFIDINGSIMFVDNNDTWEDYRDIYYNTDIYVVKCPECNKISFVNIYGSYMCRSCGEYDGDHLLECDAVEFLKDLFECLSTKGKYDKYINSDTWKKTREYALDKHGRKCTICGSTTHLDVHHLNYNHLGCEAKNDYDDLCILCRSCHSKLHEFLDKNENMLVDLRNELKETKEKYRLSYLQKLEDIFYEHIKDCFNNTNKKHSLIIPYLKTVWGQKKVDTDFISYVSAQKVYCRMKNEGKL